MTDCVTVQIMGDDPVQVSKQITLRELSTTYQKRFSQPIVLAKVGQDLQELHQVLHEDCSLEFLDITNADGYRAYQRSVTFVMIYAVKVVLGQKVRVVVEHSLNKNYYCEIPDQGITITTELLADIERKMQEIASQDLPIEKYSLPIEQAMQIATDLGLDDKVNVLKYRRTSTVNFYKLDWFYDYFYGQMVPSTGYLKKFALHKSSDGFMIQFPAFANPNMMNEIKPLHKVSQIFKESNEWAKILHVENVGTLNDMICSGGLGDIVRISEAFHEKKIANIADMIAQQNKSVVLIAGPSSSGKTTFAQRLTIQLRVNGLRPWVISLDDYFVNREDTPRDEMGKPNYECLEALDVKQLNHDLSRLLAGEVVEIPSFNFVHGRREYHGRFLKLAQGDVLVLEGIHGLNEKLTMDIPKKNKFKIFISALTQLNMDSHNRIPTSDTRLIRRIVRDNRTRGTDAATTIGMWPSVLRGEGQYIFPFQEEADVFFNSALVYELCVLKQYVEAPLYHIRKDLEQYTEAKRLIKFLDSFLGMSSDQILANSILREFIGGSCFSV